jgi:hypothetical protein
MSVVTVGGGNSQLLQGSSKDFYSECCLFYWTIEQVVDIIDSCQVVVQKLAVT